MAGLTLAGVVSCKSLLERPPLSQVTPEAFFNNEADLAAYATNNYLNVFNNMPGGFSNPIYTGDVNTDNQAAGAASNIFRPGQIKVGAGTDNWNFDQIRYCNYFLDIVVPRMEAGKINGNAINIKHYVGELYFMRAWEYFKRVREVGDYPIIKTVLPDDFEVLVEANQRMPRNEVMRFVLEDLDKAIGLMTDNPVGGKNRITRKAALQVKSRAALYEGSFLRYFKGTAYVPNGPGWPGKTKDYNASYQYPTGGVDQESNWFLDQAIAAADAVASTTTLTINSKDASEVASKAISNPYFVMFSDIAGQEKYAEVLLWRAYNAAEKIAHSNSIYIQSGSWKAGLTRGFVDSYLMANGLPIYAAGSGYAGDADFVSFRKDRDWRLQLFTHAKGDFSVWPTHSGTKTYPVPPLLTTQSESVDNTGYASRKFMDYKDWGINGNPCTNGVIVIRAAEAYLDYIEAYYLRNGNLGGNCDKYWSAIRNRAGVDPDYQTTIAMTDMSKEAPNDWGAYSAGTLVDATLYNIRRERRSEFISEGMRWNDLVRWRAMDQMATTRYHIEGFNLWGGANATAAAYQDSKTGKSLLKYIGDPAGTATGFVASSPALSKYLRPFQIIQTGNYFYDGLSWHSAHYLKPLGADNFKKTSTDGNDVNLSPLYQNPGWSTVAASSPDAVQGF